jgi:hypothetical protein
MTDPAAAVIHCEAIVLRHKQTANRSSEAVDRKHSDYTSSA